MKKIKWVEEKKIALIKNSLYIELFEALRLTKQKYYILEKGKAGLSSIEMGKKTREQTKYIKNLFALLANSRNYRVYTNGLDETIYNELSKQLDIPNTNFTVLLPKEWLFDVHWYLDKGDDPNKVLSAGKEKVKQDHYCPIKFLLALECEWGNKADIKYDFQKLLFCNAENRLMVFRTNCRSIHELKKSDLSNYFVNAIDSYPRLPSKSKFIFAAFNANMPLQEIYFGVYSVILLFISF